jgi:periplasmic protein CpxP/Spy
MKSLTKIGWSAYLLVATACIGLAQAAPTTEVATPSPPRHGTQSSDPGHHRPDPARQLARFERHSAELKARLKLRADQEAAWTAFTSVVKPPATPPTRPDRAELAQLNTPERLDRLETWHQQHAQAMSQRHQATKSFYAALDAEQQKVFDAETQRLMGPRTGPDHGMHHPHHPA